MQTEMKSATRESVARRSLWRGTLGALAVVAASTLIAYAAAPIAGTRIGNQATATYNDGTGTSRTVTSNLVETVVQQVASLTLTAPGAHVAAPGTQVVYPHTLTNTGNGTDGFVLTLTQSAVDNFDLSTAAIYADANQDGVPDNSTNLIGTTVSLAPGGVFTFVVAGVVPGTATSGQASLVTVTATSTFTPAQTASNLDTTTVSNQAVLNMTKTVSTNTGAPGSGPHTFTLTYTNTGNATATAATLTDVIPTGMTYVPNSGRWSVTGATVLSDADTAAQGTAPQTIIYDFGVTLAGVTAVINQVLPGETRTLTFQVNIAAGATPGVINNTANYTYNNGTVVVGPFPTNTVPFTVTATTAVVLDDVGSPTDDGPSGDDTVTEASAPQGGTVAFGNVLHNNGTATNTFNMTFSNPGTNPFPVGTTFQLFKSDGVSPLLDTNGDSIPDTGPVAPGATYVVYLKAVLPPTATGGPFNVTKTATSVNDPTKTNSVTDQLLTIAASSVDLTNDAARTGPLPDGAPGAGPGPEASAVTTNTTSAGTTTTFTLYANNTGTTVDNYNLSAGSASATPPTALPALPAGWTVQFYRDAGAPGRDPSDTLVTNTGNVAAAVGPLPGNVKIFADVFVPAGAPAATQQVYFRIVSPTSGAYDIKHDAVALRSLNLLPNNTGQVFPGGTVVYQHTLTNNGNVMEGGANSIITFTVADSAAGFTTVVYLDVNNNGLVDPGDTVLDDSTTPAGTASAISLAAGANVRLLVKVTAPAGAALGTVDTATLTVSVAGGTNPAPAPANAVATDVTSVIAGNLTLLKEQALHAACDATAPGAFGTAVVNAAPAQCVCYRVTALNVGTANADAVVIQDPTPAFTKVSKVATVAPGTVDTPLVLVGGTGLIKATAGTLTPGQQAILNFCVKIDN